MTDKATFRAKAFCWLLRTTFKPKLAACQTAQGARAVLESGKPYKIPVGVDIEPAQVAGVPGEWVMSAEKTSVGTMLFLHGGGYVACSARTHRPVTTAFALAGFQVFAPNYRLAPEHPFPAALEDAWAVYRALEAALGGPRGLAVAGDSAGGGLALALCHALAKQGLARPAALALFSPWTDLAVTGASLARNDRRCAMFTAEGVAKSPASYAPGHDMRDPLISPLYGDLAALPPMLVHVGQDEVLFDDSERLATRAAAAGVAVDYRAWPGVPHDWQLFHDVIPEGKRSLALASSFLQARITGRVPQEQAAGSWKQETVHA